MHSLCDSLPPAIAAYVSATNRGDLDALVGQFVPDALVNDQLREHWGCEAIRTWAERDIIGERLTIKVLGLVRHYRQIILTSAIDGEFDKRGLPDPLLFTFYFALNDDKIVQLVILPGQ